MYFPFLIPIYFPLSLFPSSLLRILFLFIPVRSFLPFPFLFFLLIFPSRLDFHFLYFSLVFPSHFFPILHSCRFSFFSKLFQFFALNLCCNFSFLFYVLSISHSHFLSLPFLALLSPSHPFPFHSRLFFFLA